MNEYIDLFNEAREYLVENIEPMIETYLTGIWDPLCKYVIIRETYEIIQRDLERLFPDLPDYLLPRVKFRIFEEDLNIECGIQSYINLERNLIFLGTTGIEGTLYDLYYRESFDPRFDYTFIARYGHGDDCYFVGSKTAEAEYALGQVTPLSIAYGMAIEDGYLS